MVCLIVYKGLTINFRRFSLSTISFFITSTIFTQIRKTSRSEQKNKPMVLQASYQNLLLQQYHHQAVKILQLKIKTMTKRKISRAKSNQRKVKIYTFN